MKKPAFTSHDLFTAAEWLRNYEGTSEDRDEVSALRAIADWLEREADRRDDAQSIRSIANGAGVSVARARALLRAARNVPNG